MKVFLAGATGVVGTRLLPLLHGAGHEVVGMARSPGAADLVTAAGATAVVADGLDRDAVVAAVAASHPDVIVHHMTAIPGAINPRKLDDDFAQTNRLRTKGTDNLLAAARAAGVRRIVAQSFGGWVYELGGDRPAAETDPLLADPPPTARRTLDAIRHLERAVTGTDGVDGIALRFGFFYGPATSMGTGGSVVAEARKRRLPVIGSGTGVWSFCHVDDAAGATLAALERGAPGVYNVCDDEPARVVDWLPVLAAAVDAPRPMRVPTWIGRMAAGEVAVRWMTRNAGLSNGKAKRELGWQPRFPTWRDAFRTGIGAT